MTRVAREEGLCERGDGDFFFRHSAHKPLIRVWIPGKKSKYFEKD
jgi:hypothetical protein